MKVWRYGSLCIAGMLILGSCAGGNKLEKRKADCAERIEKSIGFYNAKKYSRAMVKLEDARMQCGGNPNMDTILYYLGMTDAKMKKFVEARTEFQRLVQDFPESPFYEEAKFRIGYVVYLQSNPTNLDQQETREAVRLLDDFIEMNPQSSFMDSARYYRTEAYEKLAKKEFDNAVFYERINEKEAAIVYYRTFLNQYIDSRLVDQVRINMVELLLKLGRESEAAEMCDDFLKNGKDKELRKRAKNLLAGLKNDKKNPK